MNRSRWAAVGAAVAVTVGGGGLMSASAVLETGEKPVFVPITPCRVMDTRPAPETVGPRATPLGPNETYTITVIGSNGSCNIPADAVGLGMNVTAINPSAASFLTVFPNGAPRPLASNLNWVAGQPPVPNAVTADIGVDGKISFYNLTGTVNVAADIVGYYVDHNHNDLYYTKPQVDAALALKANLPITGADILNNSILSIDIADNAIDGGEVLDFSLTNQDVGVLFAQVNLNGTLANSSGGVDSFEIVGFLGAYEVDFGRDVTACAFVATQGTSEFATTAGFVSTADRNGNVEAVFVQTFDAAGAFADRAFQLVVVC